MNNNYLNLGLLGTADWTIESLEAWESERFTLGEESEWVDKMVVVCIATVTGLVVAGGISIASSAQQNAQPVRFIYILPQCASFELLRVGSSTLVQIETISKHD